MIKEKHKEVISLIANLPIAEKRIRENRPSLKKAESFFRKIIKVRINHCVNNLKAHTSEAKVVSSIIVWKDGHFSIPVYMALIEAQNQNWGDWEPLIWQQIIRQMIEDSYNDNEMFRIATECILIAK